MKTLLIQFVIGALALHAQPATPKPQYEGDGYDAKLNQASRQLMALAEAFPADKYSWRPGSDGRSVSQVFVLIAQTNFYLLSVTGAKIPPDMAKEDLPETVTSKAAVIADLKRSLDAVRRTRAQLKPGDLERKVTFEGKDVSVEEMYLKILAQENKHRRQLIAYAQINWILPPVSNLAVNPPIQSKLSYPVD